MPSNVGSRAGVAGYGQATSPRQKYAGMEVDEATGMSHTPWREFDSMSARWTAPDPYGGSMELSSPQSFNRYTYVNNDPINSVDATGLMAEPCGADNSYAQCGGSGAFWGGGDFGAEMAGYGRYYGGLTSNVVEAVKGYEYRANNGLFGGGDGNSVVAYFDIYYQLYDDGSMETDFHLDGGTVGGYNPLWELAKEVNRRPVGKTFAVLYGGSVLTGATSGAGLYALGTGSTVTTLGLGGGGTVSGLYGSTSVAALESLASSGGPTVQVVTNLTGAPAVGRGLSVAIGDNASALAGAARTGGQLFRGSIPRALLSELERVGLAQRITVSMGGVTGTEIRFLPQASKYIVQFFK